MTALKKIRKFLENIGIALMGLVVLAIPSLILVLPLFLMLWRGF